METFGDTTRGISGDGMTTTDNGLYYDPYDPYDFEIDKNPYPIWKRLRDERPLYYTKAAPRTDDAAHTSTVCGWERLPVITR